MTLGEWSEARHEALTAELEQLVASSWKEAASFGTMTEGPRLDADLMFEDVFKEMPEHLQKQQALMRAERSRSPRS
jgi:2-oxoisovalerate dehydrogenase E1 component alpha subunit